MLAPHSFTLSYLSHRITVKKFLRSATFALLGAGAALQAQPNFATPVAAGTGSATQLVTVTFTATGPLSAINALTQGISTSDFSVQSGGTCSIGTPYSIGQSCTISVKFAPTAPGPRSGALVLSKSDGATLGVTMLFGSGSGAIGVWSPATISTIAGNGAWTFVSDGVLAVNASIYLPNSVVEDVAGNIYLADSNNNRIRRIDASTGVISTVAGNGQVGYSPDGTLATSSELSIPSAVVIDGAGNLYISDTQNSVIRVVDAVTHTIRTIAGIPSKIGYSGDTGSGTSAKLNLPNGLALDTNGNLFIADTGNNVIRKLNLFTQVITTVAGTGGASYGGDGGPATSATLNGPWSLSVQPDGTLYIADTTNNVIRKVTPTGTISTIAGTHAGGFSGEGGPATAAQLYIPAAVITDLAGNIYIADTGNNRIRKIDLSGNITSIAGNIVNSGIGDDSSASQANLYAPYALYLDAQGNLLIADMFHNRIRKISSGAATLQYPDIRVDRTSAPQPQTFENDGNASLNITAFPLSGAALDPATTTCAISSTVGLNPGQSCVIGAEFAPTVVGNPVYGTIQIQSNAVNTPSTLTLYGNVLTLDPTTVGLVSSLSPSATGTNVTFTASVATSGTKPPSGTVTFYDGTTSLGTATIAASALAASLTTHALTTGTHTITAAYNGDTSNNPSVSPALIQIVKQSTSTSVISSAPSVTAHTSVTFTATVKVTTTGTITAPTGSVLFKDGATILGSAPLDPTGKAAFTFDTLAVGAHSITATYSGDGSSLTSTSTPITETINKVTSTVLLSSSMSPANVGATVTFTATVTSSSSTVTPTGTIDLKNGSTLIGTFPLIAGVATMPVSSLPVGTNLTITANYSGDSNTSTGTTSTLQTIQQITTTTLLSSNGSTIDAGAALLLTATVTPAATTGGNFSGTVIFKDTATGNVIGSPATISATGVATLSISSLAIGSYHITATYSGNTNFVGSTSTAQAETIQQATTTTALIPSANPSIAGKPLTLTATVTGNGGIPTGIVTFKTASTTLGTAHLDATGKAALSTTLLIPPSQTIIASYGGDTNDKSSDSPALTETITQATSTVVLTSSINPALSGVNFTLTATVTTTGGIPTGTILFKDGFGNPVAPAATLASGVATLTTSLTSSQLITAVYSGDTDDTAATSNQVNELVNLATTSAIFTATPSPAVLGTPVTLSSKITSSGVVPTGTVTFYDDSSYVIGSGIISGGVATATVSTLPLGIHALTARYSGDIHNASTSATLSLDIQPSTSTIITSSINPSMIGVPVTFLATVSGSTSTPTGSVTFKNGSATIGTAPLNASAVASITTSGLPLGNNTITAIYGGDSSNGTSTGTFVQKVIQDTSTITLTPISGSIVVDSAVTLNATVTGYSPSGAVSFLEGGNIIGTGTIVSGVVTAHILTLGLGSHIITASYVGDVNNTASSSNTITVSIGQASPTLALSLVNNNVAVGTPVTLISTLANYASTPIGTITFKDGSTILGTAPVSPTGVASFTSSSIAAGSHPITATYSGDINNTTAISTSSTLNILQLTSVALGSDHNPVTAGDPLILTATVSAANVSTLSGSIAFKDGATTIGTSSLSGTTATLSISTLSVGTHSITATYSGNTVSETATSPALSQTVQVATTKVTLTSSANPGFIGSSVTFTANITGNGAPLTGNITFLDGGTIIGTGAISGGIATFTTNSLSIGTHAITARFNGDASNLSATSDVLTEIVQQKSTTVLTSSLNPSLTTDAVLLTATVTNTSTTPLTGKITFLDSGAVLGTVALNDSGIATLSTATLAAGKHNITASYSGDSLDLPSTSAPLQQIVNLRPTTNSLSTSATSITQGQELTLVSVILGSGPAAPTGTVTFTAGSTVLGTATLNSVGVATFTFTPTANSYSIVASYSGDILFAPSVSTATTIKVAEVTSFTMSLSKPAVSMPTSQHTVVNLTLGSVKSFTDTLNLGCAGLPVATTCTFSQTEIALDANGNKTVQLTVDTGNPLGAGAQASAKLDTTTRTTALACLLPGGLLFGMLLFGKRSRRPMITGLLLLFVLAGAMGGLTGCGTSLKVNSTPPGAYTFQVTATALKAGMTQSVNMTMTVTQ